MTSSNFVFRKSLYSRIGGLSNYRYVLDYDYLFKCLMSNANLGWIDDPLLKYRLHSNNTIYSNPFDANSEAFNIVAKYIRFLNQKSDLSPNDLEQGLNQLFVFLEQTKQAFLRDYQFILDQKDNADKYYKGVIHSKNNIIQDRDKWINERDNLIKKQQNWILDRDKWINERDNLIKKQQNWILDRDKWIIERDNLIKKQQNWIFDRDHWIDERNKWIEERNEKISNLEIIVSEIDSSNKVLVDQLSDRNNFIKEKEKIINDKIRHIENISAELVKIKSTLVYRLFKLLIFLFRKNY